MAFMGLHELAMITLAVVFTATIISVGLGVPLGILGARSDRFDGLIRPVLDMMQTMPSFVYLIPAVMLFGIGKVPAVIATVIYAIPPIIRLTNLGIRQVDPEVVEAARSFGTTYRQLLFKVQLPMAVPTIMAGLNQTIMMGLAMVVVASMIGAGGLGDEVLRGINRLEVGRGTMAGIGIVVLAIIIDRITQGMVKGQPARST
jgi:glycine betaine/proline transport system permease protein